MEPFMVMRDRKDRKKRGAGNTVPTTPQRPFPVADGVEEVRQRQPTSK
jgi:hypothetical protein